jgi:hypothetical protein
MLIMGSLIELSNITSGLTSDCITCSFTSLEALQADAFDIFDKLRREDANQFILIYNLPEPIRKRLDDKDETVLDFIAFRFMFEGHLGLIKIVADDYHIYVTRGLRETISFAGIDAKWWFQNSHGAVRAVITLNISRTRKTVVLEKWQLSHASQPVTTAMAQALDEIFPPMPPLGLQRPEIQDPFIAQKATITPDAAIGTLHLHFQALFDRPPGPTECDLVIDASALIRLGTFL